MAQYAPGRWARAQHGQPAAPHQPQGQAPQVLLARQKALRGERRLPFITPLVFLSSPDLDCRLPPEARDGVHGLDGDKDKGEPSPQGGGLAGIVEALTHLSARDLDPIGVARVISEPIASGSAG